ncbi:hypothetical protein TNCV_4814731 [Trichonephila clavipes]|nr:hypothetical protein TNCV_4814731 [Trichonephila clavipes]
MLWGDVLQHARLHHPENTQQLKQKLIEEWALLPQKMLHQLVLSMRRRHRRYEIKPFYLTNLRNVAVADSEVRLRTLANQCHFFFTVKRPGSNYCSCRVSKKKKIEERKKKNKRKKPYVSSCHGRRDTKKKCKEATSDFRQRELQSFTHRCGAMGENCKGVHQRVGRVE